MNDNMKNTENLLKHAWNEIEAFRGGSLQLRVKHPLEWHVAYETPTHKALIIISPHPIDGLDPSKSILTACNKRADGQYYISFQLLEKTQEDVFISMCSDLIDYSSQADNAASSLNKVSKRYKQWRRLMEHQSSAVLSGEKRLGLIGELLYLRSIFQTDKPYLEVLNGWVGPDGGDQDFVYNGIWREIKTTGQSSDQITVSSFEQLGNMTDKGKLVIYRVDPCAPETNGAFSIRNLVNSIKEHLREDLKCIELLTEKLNKVGYIDIDLYDQFLYKFFSVSQYEINENFPRLTRDTTRNEIVKCNYTLSIASIANWKTR